MDFFKISNVVIIVVKVHPYEFSCRFRSPTKITFVAACVVVRTTPQLTKNTILNCCSYCVALPARYRVAV